MVSVSREAVEAVETVSNDDWRCAFWYYPGQNPQGPMDEDGRCLRLAVRVDGLGRRWCDYEDHGA
jgi:hypothetical protein